MYRIVNSYKVILCAVIFCVCGCFLLFFSSDQDRFNLLMGQIGGVLIATGIITISWEFVLKRSFYREVLASAGVASSVDDAGIVNVSTDYQSLTSWDDNFSDCREFTLFAAYANTWVESNRKSLVAFSRRPNTTFCVILPDPECDAAISSVALRSGKSVEEVKNKINRASEKFQQMLHEGSGCTIRYYAGPQTYAAYHSDVGTVVTLYANSPEKSTNVVTIKVKDGTFCEVFSRDLKRVLDGSRIHWKSDN